MIEEWRKVPGVEYLWASNLGRVKSEPYVVPMPYGGTRIRELSPTFGCTVNMGSYSRKNLTFRRKTYIVASLVCAAFNGPRPEGLVTSHLDENSLNNAANNLIWTTQKKNMNMPQLKEYQRQMCRIKMTA